MPKSGVATLTALQSFAQSIQVKLDGNAPGEPEDQLRAPFETFITAFGAGLHLEVVPKGESRVEGAGRPDYAILVNGVLAGHAELKEPGKGAKPERLRGHDKSQWEKFKALPNLLYCDGNEWGLYRSGEQVLFERVKGDVASDGARAITETDAPRLDFLLQQFLRWQPIVPKTAEQLARFLAPVCRLLRDEVAASLTREHSPLTHLAKDWRKLLFPGADDHQFADAYAQTVTFALLLARAEGKEFPDVHGAVHALQGGHSLLSKALEVLTDPQAEAEISSSLQVMFRLISVVPPRLMAEKKRDPWLYFYEDFLSVYDPGLRKDAGAYYTPVEVVGAQVRLVDELLRTRLGKPYGFADQSVVTLDPAVGTGTYLLGIIRHALDRIAGEEGDGAAAARATSLATALHGFENMVGPYAVSQLRVSRALTEWGAYLQPGQPGICLTDTLESPHGKPKAPPLFYKPISDEHERARRIKEKTPVLVCLGNPPYDRHAAAEEGGEGQAGGWVRWGDKGDPEDAIFSDFTKPVIAAGDGHELKNLYNLYTYFWRWALWKTFEQNQLIGPGVVSFITASSYLGGPAFAGMRQHLRQICDEVWILDLGGEGLGTRPEENVFAIVTPVAIAIAVRYDKSDKARPAKVHYTNLSGTRQEKLTTLEAIGVISDLSWEECPCDWRAPFIPPGTGSYFENPLLTDLLPWRPTGSMTGRTWVVGTERECLKARWRSLMAANPHERAPLFVENPSGRKVTDRALSLRSPRRKQKQIYLLNKSTEAPEIIRYGYRAFDRHWLLADGRVIDRPCPDLWDVDGAAQLYLTSLFNQPLGAGPALVAFSAIPDKHAFRGSYGGRNVFPMYKDRAAKLPNIAQGLLGKLSEVFGRETNELDVIAYIYGILAHPAFTSRFAKELTKRELHVPLTKNKALFGHVQQLGARLLWLHTYGERFVAPGRFKGQIPRGGAKNTKAVSDRPDAYPEQFHYALATQVLFVGDGEFAPVTPEVWAFEISGLKVVQSWLGYRMKDRKGKRSSPLDNIGPERWTAEFTTELLHLLWVLEATLAIYPEQARLLDQVLAGPLFTGTELQLGAKSGSEAPSGRLFECE